MSAKTLVMIGLTAGSLVGGYIPTFFGVSPFSFLSLLGSTIGGCVGVYIGFKISNS